MKKRMLSLFLAVVIVVSIIPSTPVFAGTATMPPNLKFNTMTQSVSSNGKVTGKPAEETQLTTAYVRNAGGVAQHLEVVVNLEQFSSSNSILAVVMNATDYDRLAPNGPFGVLNDSTYCTQVLTDTNIATNRYAIGRAVVSSAAKGDTAVLRMVTPNPDNHNTLGGGDQTKVAYKNMPKAAISGTNYLDEYVLVVFRMGQTVENKNFYIDRFYVDSEGYVLTPSYAVRYNENNPTTGTGSVNANSMPKNNNSSNNRTFVQRAAWNNAALGTGTPGDMRLSDATPTRTGYKFLGWTDKALKPLPEGATVPENGHQVTSDGTTATFYTKSGTYPQPATLHQVYDLYALWQVVPVKFSHQVQSPYTSVTQEDGQWVITWKETPQVGVALKSNSIVYEIPATTGAEPNGDKTFSLEVYQGGKKVSASGNKWNELTVGRVGDNAHWGIAGSPKDHSYDADNNPQEVRMVITVTDPSNGTKDTITVKFPFIEKRSQPIPTLDANTGLQTRVEPVTPDESDGPAEDGQIYGFYSTGPVTSSDYAGTGYLPTTATAANGTYGTGTMTGYYLNLGMVFEYRPVQVGTTKIDWTADPADYKEMPNDGWREMPFPRNWYDKTEQAKLDPTLMKKATTITYSIRAGNNNAGFDTAKETAINGKLSEKFKTDGWLESYGWIAFDNSGLPVIHGLAEDDIYEVRFRANSTSAPSTSRTIPISKGGAVAGTTPEPTAGAGLAINLAGGGVTDAEKAAFEDFRKEAAALEPGDTLKIPNITPERENYRFLGWILNGDTSVVYKYTDPNAGSGGSEPGGEPETPPVGGEVTADETEAPGESGGTTTEPGTEGGGTETPDPGDGDGGDEGDDPSTPSTNTKDTVTLEISPSSLAAYWQATTDGFFSITFYDWDGVLLGSKIVVKSNDATEQATLVTTAFEEAQKDYATALSSHPGYDFGCWIPQDSDTPTAYGVRSQSADVDSLSIEGGTVDMSRQLEKPDDEVKAESIKGTVSIKAAYVADPETLAISDVAARQYTVTPIDYNRYGTAGVLSITVQIERKNASGQPVPRPASPALRVAMTAGGATTYTLYELDGKDTETVEIVPFATTSAGVTAIEWAVIDTYGVSNWAGVSGSRLSADDSKYTRGDNVREVCDGSSRNVLKRGKQQFLYECYLGWINSVCEEQDPKDTTYSSLSAVNGAQLRAFGVGVINSGTGTVVGAGDIRKNIYSAWYAKNYNSDGTRKEVLQDLTKREITDALGTTANSVFSEGE